MIKTDSCDDIFAVVYISTLFVILLKTIMTDNIKKWLSDRPYLLQTGSVSSLKKRYELWHEYDNVDDAVNKGKITRDMIDEIKNDHLLKVFSRYISRDERIGYSKKKKEDKIMLIIKKIPLIASQNDQKDGDASRSIDNEEKEVGRKKRMEKETETQVSEKKSDKDDTTDSLQGVSFPEEEEEVADKSKKDDKIHKKTRDAKETTITKEKESDSGNKDNKSETDKNTKKGSKSPDEINILIDEMEELDKDWKQLVTQAIDKGELYVRSGLKTKDYYTYLLIDPELLIMKKIEGSNQMIFRFSDFIRGIYYVGKGTKDRVMSYAEKATKLNDAEYDAPKLKRVRSIWAKGKGYLPYVPFNNLIEDVAFAFEAAVILYLISPNKDIINHPSKGGNKHLYNVAHCSNINNKEYYNCLTNRQRGRKRVRFTDSEFSLLGYQLLYQAYKFYAGHFDKLQLVYKK